MSTNTEYCGIGIKADVRPLSDIEQRTAMAIEEGKKFSHGYLVSSDKYVEHVARDVAASAFTSGVMWCLANWTTYKQEAPHA